MRHTAAYLTLAVVCFFCRIALAQDMPLSQVLIDGEGWQLVAEGYKFTEGPAVDGQGNIYFADVPASTIHKIGPSGKVSLFLADTGKTSGLMFGPDGRLYACQNGARQIVAYDVKTKLVDVIADEVDCNDLVVTGQGGIYFTDPKNHQVWYIDPDGKKRVVDRGIETPNGIILWPDQQTLVVTDTRGPNLWAFRIESDGSLSFKQPFYTARPTRGKQGSGGDGMTVDRDGRLYAATYAGLQMFDTQGRFSGVILKPQNGFLSNAVFAGPNLDTLYITCTDKIYRRKTQVRGVRFSKTSAEK